MAHGVFRRKVMNRIWKYVKNSFLEQISLECSVIQNLNYSHIVRQKKAVICYQTYSFFFDWENSSSGRTQPFEILSIVDALSKLDYCIDIIDCNDVSSIAPIARKKYDLIFGFGETFFQLTQRQPWAISVLYMTEQHPVFSYREEQKRVNYFNKRHNRNLKISRSGTFYKLKHLYPVYSSIIVMGEAELFHMQYKETFTIFPTGLLHPGYTYTSKTHHLSRKHFLWLGTPGATIHKGLDLLLDIFSELDDITLHIGGITKKDKKVLNFSVCNNIHDHGYIDITSDLFLKLIEQCSYIILPSCSEACATSVTTGMLHGLIPVVMKDAGFNRLGVHAIFLEDFKLPYLKERLTDLSNQNPEDLEQRSKDTYAFARENFSIMTFNQNILRILSDILNTHKKCCKPVDILT